MKKFWAHPSLSRDFNLLLAASIALLLMLSAWLMYITYAGHVRQVTHELENESIRVEKALAAEMGNANYLLTALGRQIAPAPDVSNDQLAQILKSFDSKDSIYSIFSWVNASQQVAVSSNRGALEKPVDISDRDYVKKALSEPWKMQIGRPIEGRVSGHWVIPVAMGITDYAGKFIGTIMVSIDINMLTDKISTLIRRDGLSFAIVSKGLIPLAQVSDDKDFVADNFPAETLGADFSRHPSGLVARGRWFWSAGNYAYYHVAQDYPYIILLGYDARTGDEAMRAGLWPRLLQMLIIIGAFVLSRWLIRTRMLAPLGEMTSITAAIARGEPYAGLRAGGRPAEITQLGAEIERAGEYIRENKRIESELRGKIVMLRRQREEANMALRGKSEFLAAVCQELCQPLTTIIGSAQVMKDQLHGPIENRKYRQYAQEIHQSATALLARMQDIIAFSKIETHYIELIEKPVDLAAAIHKALRFLTERLQAEKLNVKVKLSEPLPRLIADEFHLQQIIMNLLLYATRHTLPESTMLLEIRTVQVKEQLFLALLISTQERNTLTHEDMLALVERLAQADTGTAPAVADSDISLELARTFIHLHQARLDITQTINDAMMISVLFSNERIRFMETRETEN